MTDLPLLGAAMTTRELAGLQDFILAEHRDLELQDFVEAETLNGDWRPLADEARRLLDGYQGRLGIHGPFWGLNIASPDVDIRKIVTHRMMQGLEVCAYLGATQMVIHSPYTTWDFNNLDNFAGRAAYQRVIENCHATLSEPVRRAESLGVTMVVENIEDKDPEIRRILADKF